MSSSTASKSAPTTPVPSAPATSMKPRRGLLMMVSVVFTFWVAAMLAMYFKTVYPQRHPTKPATSAALAQ